jgi:hypothetical protein
VTLSGDPAQINAALAGLSYLGNLNFNGADTLTVATSDGELTTADTVAITVEPVDDAPVNTVPGPQTFDGNTVLPIPGVSVATLNTDGVVVGVSRSGGGTLTIAGTVAEINAALATLTYLADVGFSGDDTLTVTTSDGTSSDTDTVAITVTPSSNTAGDVDLSNTTINEFSPDGTVVGMLTATDPNLEGTFTYALLDDAGSRFALAGANLTVAHGLLLDFEQAIAHTINVRVTDSIGESFERTFLIRIGNVDPEQVTESAALTGAPAGTSIVGGPLDDAIALNVGNNLVDAGAGNDVVTGGPGNDQLTGNAGFDTAIFSAILASTTPDDFGQWIDIAGPDGSDRLFTVRGPAVRGRNGPRR